MKKKWFSVYTWSQISTNQHQHYNPLSDYELKCIFLLSLGAVYIYIYEKIVIYRNTIWGNLNETEILVQKLWLCNSDVSVDMKHFWRADLLKQKFMFTFIRNTQPALSFKPFFSSILSQLAFSVYNSLDISEGKRLGFFFIVIIINIIIPTSNQLIVGYSV